MQSCLRLSPVYLHINVKIKARAQPAYFPQEGGHCENDYDDDSCCSFAWGIGYNPPLPAETAGIRNQPLESLKDTTVSTAHLQYLTDSVYIDL